MSNRVVYQAVAYLNEELRGQEWVQDRNLALAEQRWYLKPRT
jgi:hypothetical protein